MGLPRVGSLGIERVGNGFGLARRGTGSLLVRYYLRRVPQFIVLCAY